MNEYEHVMPPKALVDSDSQFYLDIYRQSLLPTQMQLYSELSLPKFRLLFLINNLLFM